MQDSSNIELLNTMSKERKLAAFRGEILSQPSEKALDMILDAKFPASLVQSFPEQDLHFLMHHVGEEDFLPVLAMADSRQWEYIMDVEVWNGDRMIPAEMTRIISTLYKADAARFLRWAILEKTEIFEHYIYSNLEIRILEHDQDPSDFGDDFTTIDSVVYFRFRKELYGHPDDETGESFSEENEAENDSENNHPNASDEVVTSSAEEAEALIMDMLNTVADMDISVCHLLLLETKSVIPAEIEEDEFRLRNVRLAEKGFLPPHEAVAVYQPLKVSDLRKRAAIFTEKPLSASELPSPPGYPSLILKVKDRAKENDGREPAIDDTGENQHAAGAFSDSGSFSDTGAFSDEVSVADNGDNLFAMSLRLLDRDANISLNIQSEFAFLINSVISADRVRIDSRETLDRIISKVCSYLSLGIEVINSDSSDSKSSLNAITTPDRGSEILRRYPLKDIFRVASGRSISLKTEVISWYNESNMVRLGLKLTFLDEEWMGVIGGLMLKRPLFFDNYTASVLYRPFTSLEDIKIIENRFEAIREIDRMVGRMNPEQALLSRRFITWKSLFLTSWVVNRMSLDKTGSFPTDGNGESMQNLSAIPVNRFKRFFTQLFSHDSDEPDMTGKIAVLVREDFFSWLVETGIAGEESLSENSREIFERLFDELEEEYGMVSSDDLDPELISHFIFM